MYEHLVDSRYSVCWGTAQVRMRCQDSLQFRRKQCGRRSLPCNVTERKPKSSFDKSK